MFIEPSGTFASIGMVGLTNVDVNEPIGICYLAAVAKRAGFQTRVIQQFPDITNNEVLNLVKLYAPHVVGISTMTFNYKNGVRLAQEVKKFLPRSTVVFGGVHATLNPEIVKDPGVDFAVLGEGEKTFLDLISQVEAGASDFRSIPGLSYKSNGNVFVTQKRGRLTSDELTTLPFPDREDLAMTRYKRFSLSYPAPSKQRHASMNFGRGCNYACTFCTSPREWQGGWIGRSPENAVDEIEYLIEKYETNFLFFRDEDILLNKEKLRELCEEILRRGIKISWYCHARVSDINGCEISNGRELLSLMKKAGCFEIVYGIETGDPDTLSKINKGTTLSQTEMAVKLTQGAGIMTGCLFMIGFPWETKETLLHTLNFARSLKYDRIRVAFATPFRGTIFYEQAKADLLTEDSDKFTGNEVVIRSKVPTRYLHLFQRTMYKKLYVSWTYFLRSMKKVIREPKLLHSYIEWLKFLYYILYRNSPKNPCTGTTATE